MPRSYKRKRQDPPVNLENMKKAVGAYLKKEGTLRQIAENFGIKKSTLLDYVRRSRPQTGEADKSVNEEPGALQINFPTRPKHNRQVFESEHERKLADYFRTCSRMNHGLTTTEARKFAYSYARANNISVPENWCFNEAASKDWLLAFLKRNSDISVRKPEATSQAESLRLQHNCRSDVFWQATWCLWKVWSQTDGWSHLERWRDRYSHRASTTESPSTNWTKTGWSDCVCRKRSKRDCCMFRQCVWSDYSTGLHFSASEFHT